MHSTIKKNYSDFCEIREVNIICVSSPWQKIRKKGGRCEGGRVGFLQCKPGFHCPLFRKKAISLNINGTDFGRGWANKRPGGSENFISRGLNPPDIYTQEHKHKLTKQIPVKSNLSESTRFWLLFEVFSQVYFLHGKREQFQLTIFFG